MLLRKNMLTPAEAVCPIFLAEMEDASHIIFRCPLLCRFWDAIGAHPDRVTDVRKLYELPRVVPGKGSTPLPPSSFSSARTCGSIGTAWSSVVIARTFAASWLYAR
jgi:hypothetical protein